MTPTRRQILDAINDLSRLFPGWRFGQMVANFCWLARGPTLEALLEAEDDQILAKLRDLLRKHADRQPPARDPCQTDYHDPTVRQEIARAIEELSHVYPTWRFSQLVVTVAEWARDSRDWGIYDVEDADFLAAARKHLQEQSQREQSGVA